jgi:hypothetical protein
MHSAHDLPSPCDSRDADNLNLLPVEDREGLAWGHWQTQIGERERREGERQKRARGRRGRQAAAAAAREGEEREGKKGHHDVEVHMQGRGHVVRPPEVTWSVLLRLPLTGRASTPALSLSLSSAAALSEARVTVHSS